MFILTREPFPDPYLIKRLYGQIKFFGLNTRRLKKIDQRSCPTGGGYGKSANETEQYLGKTKIFTLSFGLEFLLLFQMII